MVPTACKMAEIAQASTHTHTISYLYIAMKARGKCREAHPPILANLLHFCYHVPMISQQTTQPGWNIVGHEHAIDRLRRTLAARQVRHAYLFTGPEHIGKSLLAHRFAQTLLCTGGADPRVAPLDPCNTCLSCRKVAHGNHPDLHIISRAPDKQFILIEQVRALQSDSTRKSLEG